MLVKNAMVGMNSIVMDGAKIGESAIVGAMSFVKAENGYSRTAPRCWQSGKNTTRIERYRNCLENERNRRLPRNSLAAV